MKNIKRLVTLLPVAALVLAVVTVGCGAEDKSGFEDVPADAWYAEAVEYCWENGLMSGTSGDRFEPDGAMTRAMLATALYRQAGEPAVAGVDSFDDTAENTWYSNAVLWASQRGIINGYGNGLFGTDDLVTREQLVTILWRMAGSPAAENSTSFADQSHISGYAVTAVAWVREKGIVNGKDSNRFDPKGSATRAEVAAVLANQAKAPVSASESTLPAQADPGPVSEPVPAPESTDAHILVAYFSATNNTKSIASHIKAIFGDEADLYEIVPETPYTSADLNYNTDCRANREQNDPSARPAISGSVEDMEKYDVIFLGYPIWWGQAPKIMYTFAESYDLTGKTIVPFCTSGSSPAGSSATNLAAVTTGANWFSGSRFSGSTGRSAVESWINGLELPKAPDTVDKEMNRMYVKIGETVWTAALNDNPSVIALKELLSKGPLTIDMSDYGDMEKVGTIGTSLVRSDRQTSVQPGDIILYQGTSITIYYSTNSWNFTHLGHVENVTEAQLREVLKAGGDSVSVTFSLTDPTA